MRKNASIKGFWIYYVAGAIFWLFIFKFVFSGPLLSKTSFIFAHSLCFFVLAINIWLNSTAYVPREYKIEEKIYEYVERNAHYLIMAVTIFLLISANGNAGIFASKAINMELIVYSQACSVVWCILIIALYWMPTRPGKEYWLVHLRHLKTIALTYALSFFFIGPIEVVLSLRDKF